MHSSFFNELQHIMYNIPEALITLKALRCHWIYHLLRMKHLKMTINILLFCFFVKRSSRKFRAYPSINTHFYFISPALVKRMYDGWMDGWLADWKEQQREREERTKKNSYNNSKLLQKMLRKTLDYKTWMLFRLPFQEAKRRRHNVEQIVSRIYMRTYVLLVMRADWLTVKYSHKIFHIWYIKWQEEEEYLMCV